MSKGDRRVTIVMYHYVRELEKTAYPEINGLHTRDFVEQIAYAKKHYQVVSGHQVVEAIRDDAPLPPRPLLLTFDDAYRDHYSDVLPILEKEGIQGCFFPPSGFIRDHRVLPVNKIHFVLASVEDKKVLASSLCEQVESHRARGIEGLRSIVDYQAEYAKPSRWDPAEIVFLKRMLQRGLPEALRAEILDELFRTHVSADEAAFSETLYMNRDELAEVVKLGHMVGSHGDQHLWMDSLTPAELATDVDRSIAFLADLGVPPSEALVSYPFGGYSDSVVELMRERGFPAGVTIEVRIADLERDDPLLLPRINTNDLPTDRYSAPNEWSLRA